ncbi:MAG: hypothetical protein WCZ72_09610 [Gemmobacter sp.]
MTDIPGNGGPLRLLDTGLASAGWNIAMTAALAELHRAGRAPDTLRLHRYPRSVLLGRHQPLSAAEPLPGVEVARRVTGGGAVYMAPGVVAWELVTARRGPLDALAATVCGAVAAALGGLGYPARFQPPGDVLLAGGKVSGSAGWHEGNTVVLQGTVLVAADLAELARALRLDDPGVAALPAPAPDPDTVARAVAEKIAAALGRPLVPGTPGAEERARADRLLAREIGTAAFIAGEEPA